METRITISLLEPFENAAPPHPENPPAAFGQEASGSQHQLFDAGYWFPWPFISHANCRDTSSREGCRQ